MALLAHPVFDAGESSLHRETFDAFACQRVENGRPACVLVTTTKHSEQWQHL